MSRPSFAVLILGLALAVAGCAAAPEPEPTPTGFASEEEAFAAAEETYRAYVEAANRTDLSDPRTFEPLYELTTDGALAAAREEFTMMHAEGYTRKGESAVTLVSQRKADLEAAEVELDVCIDNSDVDVLDSGGTSVVSQERLDIQPMLIVVDISDAKPLISSATARTGEPACPES
jgi:hypothetical protein